MRALVALSALVGVAVLACASEPERPAVMPQDSAGGNYGLECNPHVGYLGCKAAENVLADMRPDFRACYAKAASLRPGLRGLVVLDATIDPQGNVTQVSRRELAGLDSDFVDCLEARVKRGKFTPRGPQESRISFPLRFAPSP